jgi:poly-gamma-glutamate capsule biosynthesis protein CapA/YwtB (metallophosphatase superfamily)
MSMLTELGINSYKITNIFQGGKHIVTKKDRITLLGVGDIVIDRVKPETIFQHTAPTLRAADITYGNCDQTYSDLGYLVRGHGTNSESKNFPALLYAGFDVISLSNNHTLDWGEENLLDTLERFKKSGLPYVGAGKDIIEARKPVILERNETKVGFLAYSCTIPKDYEASETKPGLSGIHVKTVYEQVDYQPGTPPKILTITDPLDLAAMIEDIKELKTQSDVVVIAIHWGVHIVPRVIPMYCFEIGHAAIEAGADLILGTHPHILKGVEMHKGKAIFYSTCNFAAEIGPATRKNPGGDEVYHILDRYGCKPDPECPTYLSPPDARNTLIVKAIIENAQIQKLSYIPCYINKNAEPVIVGQNDALGQKVYNYLADISHSEKLPVHFAWDGDEVLISP